MHAVLFICLPVGSIRVSAPTERCLPVPHHDAKPVLQTLGVGSLPKDPEEAVSDRSFVLINPLAWITSYPSSPNYPRTLAPSSPPPPFPSLLLLSSPSSPPLLLLSSPPPPSPSPVLRPSRLPTPPPFHYPILFHTIPHYPINNHDECCVHGREGAV